MNIQESGEMYLENILILSQQKDRVRSVDIAERMGFSKPSVSRAVGLLRRNGYIDVDGGGSVTLTASGREIAETIYERHRILTAVLISLGVDDETAAEDACKIEHYISDRTFEAVKKHLSEHGRTE
ncbi:MAG: metal-dependent transcriptional regulator [Clostridia bacterium]|nr:metal-dependent transcriptional regulator [Clostridia bacterium]